MRYFCLIISFSFFGWFYAEDDWCNIIEIVTEEIEKKHFLEKTRNAAFSDVVFRHFFELVDPHYIFISQEDIQRFELYQKELFFENKSCEFIEVFVSFFIERINEFKSVLEDIEQNSHFFEIPRSINLKNFLEKRVVNNEVLKNDWRNYIAFLALAETHKERKGDSLKLTIPYAELLDQNKSKFLNRLDCRLRKYEDNVLIRKDVAKNFIHAFAVAYDPHTLFFTAETYNLFMEALSRDQVTYGFEIQMNKEDEYLISGIQPGSAAWKSNRIHENDQLISLSYNGQSIDLFCTSVEQIMRQLTEDNPPFIDIHLKKPNQEMVIIKLPKEEMVNQENVVKGYILEQGDMKIGYISIPTFYSGFTNDVGQSVANDAAKEIMKLNRSGISGLILDMRFNSGGAMHEAINLTGNFIDIGPVGMMTSRDGSIEILKDMNRGMSYAGPLVIMVNGMSASATEFMAGALQDYNRAIIVGDRTYGKGSVQQITPVIDFKSRNYSTPIGYLKVTTNIMYRITTHSHQGIGVQPDIELKDFWSENLTYENDEPTYIYGDSITKTLRYQALPPLPLNTLKEKSEQRLMNDTYYQQLLREIENSSRNNELILQLTIGEFEKSYESVIPNYDVQESVFEQHIFNVQNHSYDSDLNRLSSFLKELDDDVKKEISSDWQIVETFSIIKDYIEISNQ